jgi:hypothetical protein
VRGSARGAPRLHDTFVAHCSGPIDIVETFRLSILRHVTVDGSSVAGIASGSAAGFFSSPIATLQSTSHTS